ncbi:Prohormone-2 [Melipona bicolor]|uniref:Prohormone-2 n=1 Tax=Melipona bicolor TaxID=60889 RepID=A0AA40FVL7_9HYME|nr:Prohormone-2 [Melipona bicolor]
MMCDWVWLLTLCSLLVIAQSLPTNLADDAKKTEQTMRPKPKRAQEMLMFGNQQNRQPEKKPSTSYTSTAEKRTLAASGLGGLKAALAEEEKPSHSNIPNNAVYDRDSFSPYDRNYDYGKVMMNDLGYEMPQIWDVPSYSRYYMNEDRRKRSEKSTVTGSTTVKPSTTSFQSPTSTQQSVQAQVKRR